MFWYLYCDSAQTTFNILIKYDHLLCFIFHSKTLLSYIKQIQLQRTIRPKRGKIVLYFWFTEKWFFCAKCYITIIFVVEMQFAFDRKMARNKKKEKRETHTRKSIYKYQVKQVLCASTQNSLLLYYKNNSNILRLLLNFFPIFLILRFLPKKSSNKKKLLFYKHNKTLSIYRYRNILLALYTSTNSGIYFLLHV